MLTNEDVMGMVEGTGTRSMPAVGGPVEPEPEMAVAGELSPNKWIIGGVLVGGLLIVGVHMAGWRTSLSIDAIAGVGRG